MAVDQYRMHRLTHRHRGQAPSHIELIPKQNLEYFRKFANELYY